MSVLTLYHGSVTEVRKPLFGYGKTGNDFGLGFYCTESEKLSREWACKMNTHGISNRYSLDTEGLTILDLNAGTYSVMNWIAVLMKHRKILSERYDSEKIRNSILSRFYVDVDGYDLVRGYRADDSYFLIANRFIDGIITYGQLSDALKLGDFGEQIVLKSRKAFDSIEFVSSEYVSPETYYPEFASREREANEAFKNMKTHGTKDFDIRDIMEMETDDPRLF